MRKIMLASMLPAISIGYASNATAAARVTPELTTGTAVLPLPPQKPTNRGSTSLYPFASLEIGHAFGVKNKDARGLSSIVSNQNKKNRATGEGGAVVQTKLFRAFDVTDEYREANKAAFAKGGAFEGAKALVFRLDPNAGK